jgi:hypothetical protein
MGWAAVLAGSSKCLPNRTLKASKQVGPDAGALDSYCVFTVQGQRVACMDSYFDPAEALEAAGCGINAGPTGAPRTRRNRWRAAS